MKKKILALVGVLLIVCFFVAPLVQAAKCDQVFDSANLFGNKIQDVVNEANNFNELEAQAMVVTIQSRGSVDLETYSKNLVKQCPLWQGPDGNPKSRLVIFIVSMQERETGIYCGDFWKNTINQTTVDRINTNVMGPYFREGNFAAGFVAGMKEARRLMDLQLHPASVPAPQQQPQVVVIVPTSVPAQAAPVPDLSGLWRVMMFMAIAAVVLGGSFALYKFITSLVDRANRKRTEQQKAKLARQDAASLINDLPSQLELTQAKISSVEGIVSGEDCEPLDAGWKQAQTLYESASVSFAGLNHSAGDPERDLSFEQYQAITESYSKVVDTLGQANSLINNIGNRIENLRALSNSMPALLSSAIEFVDQAGSRVASVSQAGFKTASCEAGLKEAEKKLGLAQSALKSKRFTAAKDQAENARALAEKAASQAEGLQKQRDDTLALISAVQKRVKQVQATIISARDVFEQISREYAENSWTSVSGNGTEAENRVNWSLQALETANNLASMDNQEFDQASQSLSQIDTWLAEAESFMRSIVALKKNLDAAKRDAPGEIQAAQADVQAAGEYISRYDEDIRESLETDLTSAGQVLSQAQQELGKERPDYLDVVKLAKRANASADKILEQARSEREEAVRLREKAASCLRDAQAVVSKASEYIEDHGSDVESRAKSHLRQARANLESAKDARTLQDRITYAGQAESEADSAYRDAKSDVSDAEERRRPVVVVTSTPSYHSNWGTTRTTPSRHDDGPSGGTSSWGSRGGGLGGGTSNWGTHGGGLGGGSSPFGGSKGGGLSGGTSKW